MTGDTEGLRRILVYRLGSIGDTLVVLPAFHLIRRVFPKAHITLLTNIPVNPKAEPMEAILRGTNLFNDTFSYPTSLRELAKLRALGRSLRSGNYDCLIYATEPKGGLLTSIRDYLFFRCCGICRVIGVPFSRRHLRAVQLPGSDLYMSETARVLECIRKLGGMDVNDLKSWDLMLTAPEIREGDSLLEQHGVNGPFLAISSGTKIQANDWEDHNWDTLIRRLALSYPRLPLVAFGAEDERERSDRMLAGWKGPKANFCGLTSPRVSAAALRKAAVMVCHDSGPMHLAATMGVPCVAIFSARNPPGVWFPRGDHHIVIYHRIPCWRCGLTVCVENKKACILSITVDQVDIAVRKQLTRRNLPPESQPGGGGGGKDGSGKPDGAEIPAVAEVSWHPFSHRSEGGKERGGLAPQKLSILLIGNYEPDGQQSMKRFANVLAKEFSVAGLQVTLMSPEPFFGHLCPGPMGLGKWLGYMDKFLVFPRRLMRRIKQLRMNSRDPLVVHICDHSNAFYTRYLQDVPHLVTCHDLLAVRSALREIPENPIRWSGRIQQKLVVRGLERARKIVCDSEETHRDLVRMVKGADVQSSVVRIGLNAPFHPVPKDQARTMVQACLDKLELPFARHERFIAHVGGGQWYKNRKGVVEMFCELRRFQETGNLILLLVGKPLSPDLRGFIRNEGLEAWIREVPGVSHDELCALYSAAELLLFPSSHEGFGWPIIEAQACGCRVVTTGRPPMNDVGGDGAAYLDPGDLWASVEILLNVLYADAEEKNAMIRRGFANAALYSTRNMVETYRNIYSAVATPSAMITAN